jgi:hypothetical protein
MHTGRRPTHPIHNKPTHLYTTRRRPRPTQDTHPANASAAERGLPCTAPAALQQSRELKLPAVNMSIDNPVPVIGPRAASSGPRLD